MRDTQTNHSLLCKIMHKFYLATHETQKFIVKILKFFFIYEKKLEFISHCLNFITTFCMPLYLLKNKNLNNNFDSSFFQRTVIAVLSSDMSVTGSINQNVFKVLAVLHKNTFNQIFLDNFNIIHLIITGA